MTTRRAGRHPHRIRNQARLSLLFRLNTRFLCALGPHYAHILIIGAVTFFRSSWLRVCLECENIRHPFIFEGLGDACGGVNFQKRRKQLRNLFKIVPWHEGWYKKMITITCRNLLENAWRLKNRFFLNNFTFILNRKKSTFELFFLTYPFCSLATHKPSACPHDSHFGRV